MNKWRSELFDLELMGCRVMTSWLATRMMPRWPVRCDVDVFVWTYGKQTYNLMGYKLVYPTEIFFWGEHKLSINHDWPSYQSTLLLKTGAPPGSCDPRFEEKWTIWIVFLWLIDKPNWEGVIIIFFHKWWGPCRCPKLPLADESLSLVILAFHRHQWQAIFSRSSEHDA